VKFLACCVLSDKKLYGNFLLWCKYVRDFDGATQWLKATIPDRRVWLPTLACVIVAVRLNKALKGAHSKGPSNLHVRFQQFCNRHLHAYFRLPIFSQQSFLVNQLKTPSLTDKKFLVNIWTNSDCPNEAWNLCHICLIVTLLVTCLDKELIAYKTLSKNLIQVLSFVPLVPITQTATRVGPNYTLHSQN